MVLGFIAAAQFGRIGLLVGLARTSSHYSLRSRASASLVVRSLADSPSPASSPLPSDAEMTPGSPEMLARAGASAARWADRVLSPLEASSFLLDADDARCLDVRTDEQARGHSINGVAGRTVRGAEVGGRSSEEDGARPPAPPRMASLRTLQVSHRTRRCSRAAPLCDTPHRPSASPSTTWRRARRHCPRRARRCCSSARKGRNHTSRLTSSRRASESARSSSTVGSRRGT